MSHIPTHKKQILKSASIISIVTVVSRILGYVRDQRLTLLLGTTDISDSFVLAYRIPNLLRRLVGEGSMTAAFIPLFTDYMRNRSRGETWAFADRLFWTFSTFLAAALAYLGLAWLLRCDEISEVYGIAFRRGRTAGETTGWTG